MIPVNTNLPENKQTDLELMNSNYEKALRTVDDIVLKNYLSKLEELTPVPIENFDKSKALSNISLFKITEMVYAKDEYATNKYASVFNALASLHCGVFIIMNSNGQKTDFYMGINANNSTKDTETLDTTLKNAIQGQFPGVAFESYFTSDTMEQVLNQIPSGHISSVSCVANIKDSDTRENRFFIQGLEKLALAMQGKKYTGIIIANGTSQTQINEIRRCYETIYTQLSPFSEQQVAYSSSSSLSTSQSTALGQSISHAISENYSRTSSLSAGTQHSVSSDNAGSKIASGLSAAAGILGAALAPVTGGVSLAVGGVAASLLNITANAVRKTEQTGEQTQRTDASTEGGGTVDTNGSSETLTNTQGTTIDTGENHTFTTQNKTVINILDRLDEQIKRLDEFESLGMWECAAYFISPSSEKVNAEVAASTYKALMSGEHSGVEASAINSWHDYTDEGKKKSEIILQYLKSLSHPLFTYRTDSCDIQVTPCSMVSGNELALHMGLPRHSVCGFPVVEHASFGKEVNYSEKQKSGETVDLGFVRDMGKTMKTHVRLDKDRFSMHTFVTGSTGAGKSNTIYLLLEKLSNKGVKFLVIEPAKGEYKNVFGGKDGVKVYGTNPAYADLLRINPFSFPEGIHILEHIDRLIEIFNVCWPMYAAMPAILKAAVLQAYENCGWDLDRSNCELTPPLFPSFADVQKEITNVVNSSAYSKDSKGDYIGSLVTRVESLTNGLNGQIFAQNEIENELLFERNVIIDLSRVSSSETKALIMGILVMRLNEYRMANATGMNQPLKHITVLEEAHNILKRTSSEQNPDAPSVAGKSVEMLSNSIAEMRTYGEGFIIADQSPNAVDISAIRNTNTKIIMRLPDESDRTLVGRAAALNEEQLNEIAKLPQGVAVIYQNDWIEPVLCTINKHSQTEKPYKYTPIIADIKSTDMWFCTEFVKLLIKGRVVHPEEIAVDLYELKRAVVTARFSSSEKMMFYRILSEYDRCEKINMWNDSEFQNLSATVVSLFGGKQQIRHIIELSPNFKEMNTSLAHYINTHTTRLPKRILVSIIQCFIRDYVADFPSKNELYSGWRDFACSEEGRLILK